MRYFPYTMHTSSTALRKALAALDAVGPRGSRCSCPELVTVLRRRSEVVEAGLFSVAVAALVLALAFVAVDAEPPEAGSAGQDADLEACAAGTVVVTSPAPSAELLAGTLVVVGSGTAPARSLRWSLYRTR